MKFIYRHQDRFITVVEELDPAIYTVTSDPNDNLNRKYYKLTDEQVAFFDRYPTCTFEEVLQGYMNPIDRKRAEILRKRQYTLLSDPLYIAWQKYVVLGDPRAEEAKDAWLKEIAHIDSWFPYDNRASDDNA